MSQTTYTDQPWHSFTVSGFKAALRDRPLSVYPRCECDATRASAGVLALDTGHDVVETRARQNRALAANLAGIDFQ